MYGIQRLHETHKWSTILDLQTHVKFEREELEVLYEKLRSWCALVLRLHHGLWPHVSTQAAPNAHTERRSGLLGGPCIRPLLLQMLARCDRRTELTYDDDTPDAGVATAGCKLDRLCLRCSSGTDERIGNKEFTAVLLSVGFKDHVVINRLFRIFDHSNDKSIDYR